MPADPVIQSPQSPLEEQLGLPPGSIYTAQGDQPPSDGEITAPQYAVEGSDPANYYDPNNQGAKYSVLRLVSQFPNNQAGFDAATPQLQQMGFTIVDRNSGTVYRDDVGRIDIHRALSPGGGGAWQWQVLDGQDGQSGGGGPGDQLGDVSGQPGGQLPPNVVSTGPGGDQIGVSPLPPGPINPTLPGDPNPFPPNTDIVPATQVGEDELSQSLNAQLLNLLAGGGAIDNPFNQNLYGTVSDLIGNQGALDANPQDLAARLENARGPLDRLRQAQLSEAQAALANRGQLVPNTSAEGPEALALGRIEEQVAPFYAEAGRDIAIQEAERNDQRLSTALGLATGMSLSQTQTLLQTIGQGTERQAVLSHIALNVLDRNMEWNKFLAEFGLDRDQVMSAIRGGNLSAILPVLNAFLSAQNQASGGFVGVDS